MVEDLMRDVPPLPRPVFPAIDPAAVRLAYDQIGDILSLKFTPSRPATSVDIGGELWLRMDPITGEVTGIEIEGFEIGYLKKHPDLAEIWREGGGHNGAPLPAELRVPLVERIIQAADRSQLKGIGLSTSPE